MMAREQRVEPEVEHLWRDFHSCVNMTSEQLRDWLLTQGSGPEAFTGHPDLDIPEPGRSVLAVLGKRKVDLTGEDVTTMREVLDQIQALLAARPPGGSSDDDWRRALLDRGHDPLIER